MTKLFDKSNEFNSKICAKLWSSFDGSFLCRIKSNGPLVVANIVGIFNENDNNIYDLNNTFATGHRQENPIVETQWN